MFLAYVSPAGRALIDRRLYLPRTTWCDRPDRRAAASVPDQVEFAAKPALVRQMIAAALDAGVPVGWVTGDEVYGADPGLRDDLEQRGIGYVLAVGCDRRVRVNDARTRVLVDEVAERDQGRRGLDSFTRQACLDPWTRATQQTPRRLSDVVYKQMIKDTAAARTGPGGHVGATLQSSAVDPIPMVNTSEQSLPGPAEPQPRTPLLAAQRGATSGHAAEAV
uniref:transposase n=1 Tax=Micromonospora purpureochromogenes TaxID=47872 RepID=UPI0026D2C6A4